MQQMKNDLPQLPDGYDYGMPNDEERMPAILEKQDNQNIKMEKISAPGEQNQNVRHILYGLVIAFCLLPASAVLIYSGYDIGGYIFGLVSVFILGKHYQKKEMPRNSDDFCIN